MSGIQGLGPSAPEQTAARWRCWVGSGSSSKVRFETGNASDGWLAGLPGVESVRVRHRHVELLSRDSDATLRALVAADPGATGIEVTGAGLEEAFVALVGREGR